jgi:cytochrome c oxidase assembly protein subunit 15
VAFVHRWLAFGVLLLAAGACLTARRDGAARQALWLASAVTLQIALGIGVVLLHVRIELALLHQAIAILLLALNLLLLQRARAADRGARVRR